MRAGTIVEQDHKPILASLFDIKTNVIVLLF